MIDKEIFITALSQGKMDKAKQLTQEALDAGESAELNYHQLKAGRIIVG
jgi:methanogenic corrinoid protein MtbC1